MRSTAYLLERLVSRMIQDLVEWMSSAVRLLCHSRLCVVEGRLPLTLSLREVSRQLLHLCGAPQ